MSHSIIPSSFTSGSRSRFTTRRSGRHLQTGISLALLLAGASCGGGGGPGSPEAPLASEITFLTPSAGRIVNSSTPEVILAFSGAPIALEELRLTVDRQAVDLDKWSVLASGARGLLPVLAEGSHSLDAMLGGASVAQLAFETSTGGGATVVTGFLLDPVGESPIVGATIFLEEAPTITTETDSRGHYELVEPTTNALPTGDGIHLTFDPSNLGPFTDSAGLAYRYPVYKRPITIRAGARNNPDPCYLPKVRPWITFDELAAQGVFDCSTRAFLRDYPLRVDVGRSDLDDEELLVEVTIPAGAFVEFLNGAEACGNDQYLAIAPVDKHKAPSNLPAGTDPALLITFQPTGMTFHESPGGEFLQLPISFPNRDALPDGTEMELFSVDHETGQFVKMGDMLAEGGRIVTLPGGGLQGGSWHCACAPRPAGDGRGERGGVPPFCFAAANPLVDPETGLVHETFALPTRVLFDDPWGLELVYDSFSLMDEVIAPATISIDQRSAVPRKISVTGKLAGIPAGRTLWFSTGHVREDENTRLTLPFSFDVRGLATGVYPYEVQVTNHFAKSSVTAFVRGELLVDDRRQSPFGRGWWLGLDDRLHRSENGTISLLRGDGMMFPFEPNFAEAEVITTGAVELIAPPDSVVAGSLVSSTRARAFREASGVTLDRPLDVEVLGPGRYFTPAALTPGRVAAGTRIDSFFLHSDSIFGTNTYEGTIAFGGRILGVMVSRNSLNASDPALGSGTEYPQGSKRDIELARSGNGDGLEILPDGRTLFIHFETGSSVDQIRVLVTPSGFVPSGFRGTAGDFSHLAQTSDGGFRRDLGDGSFDLFDRSGRLVERTDRRNRRTLLERDATTGHVTAVVDPAQGRTTFTQVGGLVELIRDPAGRETRLEYDGPDLVRIFDACGEAWRHGYDTRGLLTSSTDPDGISTRNEYDARGRYLRTHYADGSTKEVGGLNPGLMEVLRGKGTETNPARSPLEGETSARVRDEAQRTRSESIVRDELEIVPGRRASLLERITPLDGNRRRTTRSWIDEKTRLTLRKEILESDAGPGILVARSDMQWDFERGLLLRETRSALGAPGSADRVTAYEWDPDHAWLTAMIQVPGGGALERRTCFELDLLGNVRRIVPPAPAGPLTMSYDAAKQHTLASLTDAAGTHTIFLRDHPTLCTTSTTTDGDTFSLVRNEAGQPTRIRFPDGGTTIFQRDSLGRPVSIVDASRATTTYQRSGAGRMESVTDGKTPAGVWRFGYDERGRATSWVDPLGRVERRIWGPDGALRRLIRRDGTSMDLVRDAAGRVEVVEYRRNQGSTTADSSTTIAYGPLDRPIRVVDEDSQVVRSWSSFGELLSEEVQRLEFSSRLEYVYDALGQLDRVRLFMGAADPIRTTHYTHDPGGRLTALQIDGSATYRFTPDSAGRRIELLRPDGTKTRYVYENGRIKEVTSTLAGQSVASAIDTLTYENGRVKTWREQRALHQLPDTTSVFAYDEAGRLLSVASPDPFQAQTWGPYDEAGNLRRDRYRYDEADQLLDDGNELWLHDAQGRLTEIREPGATHPRRRLHYDLRGRLVEVEDIDRDGTGTSVFRARYDAVGRRMQVDGTSYVHDHEDIVAWIHEGVLAALVVHGPGTDEPLAHDDLAAGTRTEFLADALGSSVQRVRSGEVLTELRYDAFGRTSILALQPEGPSFPAYRGRDHDVATDLSFNRARYYSASTGRFLSREPLLASFQTQADPVLALSYAYAANDPVRFSDPSGLEPTGHGSRDGKENILDHVANHAVCHLFHTVGGFWPCLYLTTHFPDSMTPGNICARSPREPFCLVNARYPVFEVPESAPRPTRSPTLDPAPTSCDGPRVDPLDAIEQKLDSMRPPAPTDGLQVGFDAFDEDDSGFRSPR